jgi:hypothetical protein
MPHEFARHDNFAVRIFVIPWHRTDDFLAGFRLAITMASALCHLPQNLIFLVVTEPGWLLLVNNLALPGDRRSRMDVVTRCHDASDFCKL